MRKAGRTNGTRIALLTLLIPRRDCLSEQNREQRVEIFISVLIGTAVGGLALLFRKSCQTSESCQASKWSTLAVGILGALLGVVSNVWIGFLARFGTLSTSSFGAILMLLLWIVAQKLLVADGLPGERD